MLISRKGHTDTIQVYSVTVMTHVKALQAGHSSQGTSEPITPVQTLLKITCLDSEKSYLIIIGPNSHEKLAKGENMSSW